MKILITGANGGIGKLLTLRLKEQHELVLIDRRSKGKIINADVSNLEEILPYFKGVDVVIHLAGFPRLGSSWGDLIKNNIQGTINIYEAAKKCKVKLVIYSSSINVYNYESYFKKGQTINLNTKLKSRNNYGLSKIISEYIGRDYNKKTNISVLNLRLGYVALNNKPNLEKAKKDKDDLEFAIWISQRDFFEIIDKGLNFKGFANLICVSNSNKKLFDTSSLKNILGADIKDNAWDFKK